MKFGSRKSLPIAILLVLLSVAAFVRFNPPDVDTRAPDFSPRLAVETIPVWAESYQIDVRSYGIVRPRRQTLLVSQITGQIIATAPNFDEGGFFSKDDVLLRIDPRDYQADVRIAEAAFADARQALAEERARAEQARIDWRRLGNEGEAPELVLREPQLLAAEARVRSAQASLSKAQLDLERTEIRAPFDGRVLRQIVELGQVVSVNEQLAEIYSTDRAEVRLPISNSDLQFVDLPENRDPGSGSTLAAKIHSQLAGDDIWQARVVRTEGAIDDAARQLHVLAEIDAPFEPDDQHSTPLKIGQYVTAEIEGRLLDNVIVIPTRTIYQGSYVYVVENGLLQRRDIEIAWSNSDDALIASGLAPGEELVVTLLGQVTSGMPVTIQGQDTTRQSRVPVITP